MSRPRPRREGTENPAFRGIDIRPKTPMMTGTDTSVIPPKMATGADKAMKRSVESARSAAAKNLMRGKNGS